MNGESVNMLFNAVRLVDFTLKSTETDLLLERASSGHWSKYSFWYQAPLGLDPFFFSWKKSDVLRKAQ